MKVHQAIARTLADIGATQLFGLIGDGNLYMVDSYVRQGGGRYVGAVHEAGAVLMALGWAQVTGRIGVATVTHGGGLTNAVTPLVEGVKCRIPMVLLAGDTPMEDREHLQKVNQHEFVVATGAGFEQLRSPRTVAQDVVRAFHRAWLERRPVVLNMPIDFQWQEATLEKVSLRFPEVRSATTSSADMDNAIGIIASSRQPVVLAGRGAMAPEAQAAIRRLAARIEAPLTTTLRGKDLFQDDEFNLGFCGTLSNPLALEVLMKSDCIVAFGASLNKYTAALGSLTTKKRIIQVSPHQEDIGQYTQFEAGLVGDLDMVADAMVALMDEAEIPGSGCRTEELREQIRNWQPARKMRREPRPGCVDVLQALHALNETLEPERSYATDGGRFAIAAWAEIDVQTPRHFVHTQGFAAIGQGLGEAIGAALGSDGRPTLLVAGDGGFMLGGLSELTTAVREKLDLVIAVCNDGSYGAEYIQFTKKDMDPALSLLAWPDLAPVAQALGLAAVTVRSSDDLAGAMAALKARERTRPFLIDFKLDPEVMPEF